MKKTFSMPNMDVHKFTLENIVTTSVITGTVSDTADKNTLFQKGYAVKETSWDFLRFYS